MSEGESQGDSCFTGYVSVKIIARCVYENTCMNEATASMRTAHAAAETVFCPVLKREAKKRNNKGAEEQPRMNFDPRLDFDLAIPIPQFSLKRM